MGESARRRAVNGQPTDFRMGLEAPKSPPPTTDGSDHLQLQTVLTTFSREQRCQAHYKFEGRRRVKIYAGPTGWWRVVEREKVDELRRVSNFQETIL